MLSTEKYAAFVVGFAIMTDSMIYTLVLPFLPDLFKGRLHVPEPQVSRWTALSFESFAVATLLSNIAVGVFTDAITSKSKPFLVSILIMLISTLLFFLGKSPAAIIVSRAIQGASTTFTWVTGLAFLVAQVGEGDLGVYVGWTTVGVAIGEVVGPLVGGPIYDYFGHWAAFGVVEALLLFDILLRAFAREKNSGVDTKTGLDKDTEASTEQESETDELLGDSKANNLNRYLTDNHVREKISPRTVLIKLVRDWFGTVLTLIVTFMVRGALEVSIPLYLIRQYSWTPSKISLALLTLTLPAAVNPVVGRFTSRQGPRWWSTAAFAVCAIGMISFGNMTGHTQKHRILFVAHLSLVGVALAVLVNSNQVAISVASQRCKAALALVRDEEEQAGRFLSWLSPSMMLSGVTISWAAGILLGPAYSSLIDYTEDNGWAVFCRGLGGLCAVAAIGSSFLWRDW